MDRKDILFFLLLAAIPFASLAGAWKIAMAVLELVDRLALIECQCH